MKVFGLFRKAKRTKPAPPAAEESHMVECTVDLVINRSEDSFSWNWKLVSPAYITRQQNMQLDVMVSQFCKHRVLASPGDPTTLTGQLILKVLP